MSTARHYYRCRACCHVVAVVGKLDTAPNGNNGTEIVARCMCDGKLELMGRVARTRGLVLDSERCACDARCTNAPGPSCDCRCGGVNHGTGRTVAVELDAGGVPRLQLTCEAECRRRAEEYRVAMEPHRASLRDMRADRAKRTYPWNNAGSAELRLAAALGQIAGLRTHAGRLKAIAKLAP